MSTPSNIILFGAGASFGSGDVAPKPPSLGGDLYPVLRRLFPGVWGALSTEQVAELQGDFEVGMQRVGRENPHALPPLQRAMASFFFDFSPGDANLYRRLATKIKAKSWDGALVTLNYERLLELSLVLEGVQPYIGNPSGAGHTVELCLPHGCCHIFCKSVRASAGGVSFSGVGISTQGQVEVVADRAEFTQRIRTDAFPPVMSYFDPVKMTTSCVNFIENQRARYNDLIQNAAKVIIIGVHVRPHDTHLWSVLAKTDAEIVYCSGRSGGREFDQWAEQERAGKTSTALAGYFADSFSAILEAVGL